MRGKAQYDGCPVGRSKLRSYFSPFINQSLPKRATDFQKPLTTIVQNIRVLEKIGYVYRSELYAGKAALRSVVKPMHKPRDPIVLTHTVRSLSHEP